MMRFVYLPASLLAVLSALRQSVGTALAVLYIAEPVLTPTGDWVTTSPARDHLVDFPRWCKYRGHGPLGPAPFFGIDRRAPSLSLRTEEGEGAEAHILPD